jgi:hypothetical protein
MRKGPWLSIPLTVLLLTGSAPAQTSFPMITHTTPVAVQRGKTTEVVVSGQMNFQGVYKALFEGEGIRAEILPEPKSFKPPLRTVRLKLTVAVDAPLGVREFRLASGLGVSSVGQLLICDYPVVSESDANNTREQAQPITLPCVVAGRIEAVEDVDYFWFVARAAETVNFEVYCARLQDKIHDLQKHAKPMLTLLDSEGRELASNDHFFFADPFLSFPVPKDGTYYLQIRDSTYDGDARWAYALIASKRPHATHVFPMAGNPGQTLEVEPVGSAAKLKPRVSLTLPKQEGIHRLPLNLDGVTTDPVTVLVSPLPHVTEQEPNDTPAEATRVQIPCGINGRISRRRDLDHFVFAATKGKAVRFEVKARRFGTGLYSSLHAVLDVMNPQGKTLARNDDTHGKEAALMFTPPANGDYLLRVRDLNSKGGDTAIYYVEADWARPDFSLRCDPDKAMIGPGSRTAWYVHVSRTNGFTGPIRVDVDSLPKGVTASPLVIPPSMTQGLVVLSADADAPRDAVTVKVSGSATVRSENGEEITLRRTAIANQEIYLPGGGRGRFDVNMQTVAVTDPSDILDVQVRPTDLKLRPGEEVRLDVTIKRRPDYAKDVTLDVLMQHLGQVYGNPLPPGVTVVEGKSKTLLGNGSVGHIVLKAAPNAAPIENVPVSVLANVSINFVVKVSYSSPPLMLSVGKSQ